MPELPTGVVTLLFTDIEGSTRLWERNADLMRAALTRHDTILTELIRRHGGLVVKSRGEGDSFFAIFPRAANAVAAALSIQRVLMKQVWRTDAPLRVRMAIHTGKVDVRESDYYGPTVNRCARLRSLAHGGQILLSGVTAQLVANSLPTGGALRDLGTHRLRDLSTPERVCALVHPDLPGDFPPIRSSDVIAVEGGPPRPTAITPPPVAEEPATPRVRLFKLTDDHDRSPDGLEWSVGMTHHTSGKGELSGDGWIQCYASPKVAALLNSFNERLQRPHLWELEVDGEVEPEDTLVPCTGATALRQVALPNLSPEDRARCAVLATREAYRSGLFAPEFDEWSRAWLEGQDRSAEAARKMMSAAENDAYRSNVLSNIGALAASKAADAASHAARAAWLRGRAADEEATIVERCAAEAVHLATRVARLDLAALADQAVPVEDEALAAPTGPAPRSRVA